MHRHSHGQLFGAVLGVHAKQQCEHLLIYDANDLSNARYPIFVGQPLETIQRDACCDHQDGGSLCAVSLPVFLQIEKF